MLPILENCWGTSYLKNWWEVPKLETLLTYTLSHYIAEMFPTLKHCWRNTCLVTLLLCSHSWNIAKAQLILLLFWTVPKFETLLTYTLSCYIAEKIPIWKHCECIFYSFTLLRSSQPWNIADVKRVLLSCCSAPTLETLLRPILSYKLVRSSQVWNIADLQTVLLNCLVVPDLETLLMYTLSFYIDEKFPTLKHC